MEKEEKYIKPYTLKNGKTLYHAHKYIGVNKATGKDFTVNKKGFKSVREAELYIARETIKFEEGQYLEKTKRAKFEKVYEEWFAIYQKTVREVTYDGQRWFADRHLLPRFKGYYVDSITLEQVQEAVFYWYSKTYNGASLLSIFNRIMKHAIVSKYATENPGLYVTRPKQTGGKKRKKRVYSKEEVLKLLSAVKNEPPKNQALVYVLLFTGLRPEEVRGLQWGDINFSKGTLTVNRAVTYSRPSGYHITPPKTPKSKREIILDANTLEVLKRWKKEQQIVLLKLGFNANSPRQWIFQGRDNQHTSYNYIASQINNITDRHGLPHLNPHAFRHTHATLLLEAGATMKETEERLGHSNITTTMDIYAHVTNKMKQDTTDKLANYVNL